MQHPNILYVRNRRAIHK